MTRWTFAGVILPICLGACSLRRAGTEENIDSQMISRREIVASTAVTAYEAIQKLRANFLSNRGRTTLSSSTSSYPTVYVDGLPYGTLSSLRTIPAEQVDEIRLYRGWEATTKYGTGNMAGVIAVTTRR